MKTSRSFALVKRMTTVLLCTLIILAGIPGPAGFVEVHADEFFYRVSFCANNQNAYFTESRWNNETGTTEEYEVDNKQARIEPGEAITRYTANWPRPKTKDDTLYFKGWSICSDAKEPEDEILPSEDLKLYAVWGEKCTVTFHPNNPNAYFVLDDENEEGKEYEAEIRQEDYAIGDNIDCKYIRPPKIEDDTRIFKGWSTEIEATEPDVEILASNNLNVYAVWGEKCTVTFHANEPTAFFELYRWNNNTHEDEVYYEDCIQKYYAVGDSVLSGFADEPLPNGASIMLKGWSTDPEATEPDAEILASKNLNVYAVWGEICWVTFYTNNPKAYYLDSRLNDETEAYEEYEAESMQEACIVGYSIRGYSPETKDNSIAFKGWSTNPEAKDPDEIILASDNLSVYAVWDINEGEQGSEETAQTVAQAGALLEIARAAKEAAQAAVDSEQEAFELAESEYNASVADRGVKERAKANALSLYEATQTATQTALNEKYSAQTAKEEAQTALTQATTTLVEKSQAVIDAQREVGQAERAVTAATSQWESEQTAAQAAFESAQEVYDNAGYEFINERVNELGDIYYSIDEIIENEKNSSYGPVTAWDGNNSLYIRAVVSDENFIEIVKDNCSYNNLKKGIEIMRRTNALRTTDRHGLNALGVSYQLVANAVVSNSISAYLRGHNLTQSSDYSYWTIDTPWNYRPRNENLSYSTAPLGIRYDPFDDLYYEERIVELGKNAGKLTQDIIDQVAAEAAADGSSYEPASMEELSSKTVTGHYLAIIEPRLTAQGAAYSYTPVELLKYMGYWKYRSRVAQEFNNTTKNIITLEQYETAIEDHFSEKKSALDNAKAEVEGLQSKPSYLQEAESYLSTKQIALNNANQAKTEAEMSKENAESTLESAESVLTEKTNSYNNAVADETNKLQEYNNAVTALETAIQIENEKENTKNTASSTLNEKNVALTRATDAETAAQAVYDSFFKIENAVISTIPNQVYTGKAIETTIEVKNKGETETLVKDTDYVVEFSNNINVGSETATVTINGIGNYTGSNSKTFTITPKAINEEMVRAIDYVAYDGEAKKPDVVVTDVEKTLEKGADYDVEYSSNIEVGTALAVIIGKGNYTGSISREFEIISREKAELLNLIEVLEAEQSAESDATFKAKINTVIQTAREALNNTAATTDDFANALIYAQRVRNEAYTELQQKKVAEAQAQAEEEAKKKAEEDSKKAAEEAAKKAAEEAAAKEAATKKAAEEAAAKQAAARAVQKGTDGTALGAGASAENAEKAIVTSTSDEGPKGSKYSNLQMRSTKQGNTNVNLTWTKVKDTKKYVIYGNACGKKNKMQKLATTTKNAYNVKKLANKKALKKGTYHKFMVVALDAKNNVISTSKVIHVATKGGKVGNNKSVTIKAKVDKNGKAIKSYKALSSTVIKKGKSITLKTTATPVNKKLTVKKHRAICYESSNTKIATVNAKGKITAKAKGTCYVYAYSQEGIFKRIKITVK